MKDDSIVSKQRVISLTILQSLNSFQIRRFSIQSFEKWYHKEAVAGERLQARYHVTCSLTGIQYSQNICGCDGAIQTSRIHVETFHEIGIKNLKTRIKIMSQQNNKFRASDE